MSFKKRGSSKWTDTPNYIMGTSTNTITTLPADIYPTGTTATVGLKGNMEQNGTPTPDNPVMPQETGEKTGNLFDEDYSNIKDDTPTYRSIYVGDGTFTLSTTTAQYRNTANVFFLAGSVRSGASTQNNGIWNGNPRTVTAVDGYVTIAYRYYTDDEISDPRSNDVMLNLGSTALPYEPYGYKIPISSADTTTNIYLGEVETTRKIGKLVLTGEENWIQAVSSLKVYRINIPDYLREMVNIPICTHYKGIAPVIGAEGLKDLETAFLLSSSGNNYYYIRDDRFNKANDFKTYLQQQYAAGTPITIWYVLATPTTGIVNEPLRKIGDYADTVSGITIPTITGANTIDVDTMLKPSEVSVNYKGWHSIQSLHRFNGSSWD